MILNDPTNNVMLKWLDEMIPETRQRAIAYTVITAILLVVVTELLRDTAWGLWPVLCVVAILIFAMLSAGNWLMLCAFIDERKERLKDYEPQIRWEGYRPTGTELDTKRPPKGGSGVPRKEKKP